MIQGDGEVWEGDKLYHIILIIIMIIIVGFIAIVIHLIILVIIRLTFTIIWGSL